MANDLQKDSSIRSSSIIFKNPSSISENDNDGQALRVEASFTSFNEKCAGQADLSETRSCSYGPLDSFETNEVLWPLFRDTAARSKFVFVLGTSIGDRAKVTHL